jgi:hypothetical protein
VKNWIESEIAKMPPARRDGKRPLQTTKHDV